MYTHAAAVTRFPLEDITVHPSSSIQFPGCGRAVRQVNGSVVPRGKLESLHWLKNSSSGWLQPVTWPYPECCAVWPSQLSEQGWEQKEEKRPRGWKWWRPIGLTANSEKLQLLPNWNVRRWLLSELLHHVVNRCRSKPLEWFPNSLRCGTPANVMPGFNICL